ncbi:MAG TPA: prepilin peptidase [Gemmatimonadaceae bacterium]
MFAGSPDGWLPGGAFTLLLGLACVTDLRTRRIPNVLVSFIAFVGLVIVLVAAPSFHTLARFAGGVLAGLAIWLPFWILGWLGAGDVKLFAAAGGWLGAGLALKAAVVAAIAGGVLSIAWLVWLRGFGAATRSVALATMHPRTVTEGGTGGGDRKRQLPYGVAMAIGLVVVWWFPSLLY